jgi:hypothetical protein
MLRMELKLDFGAMLDYNKVDRLKLEQAYIRQIKGLLVEFTYHTGLLKKKSTSF